MKLGLLPLAPLGGLLVLLAGCNSAPADNAAASPDPLTSRTPDAGAALPVAPGELLAPRGDGASTEYVAVETPYRLFGTNKGDGFRGPYAVLADAETWATRTYYVGDTIGRGLRVAAIGEHDVTLASTTGQTLLKTGASTALKVIQHKLDLAITPLGNLAYSVDLAQAQRLPTDAPKTDVVQVFGLTTLRLGAVTPDTLLAQADFKAGDLLAAIDGTPVATDGVALLTTALTTATGTVRVQVIRNGAALDRSYRKH